MTKPVPMEPTTETVVSFVARSIGQDEPQNSAKHEPKHSTPFQGVDACVAGAPGKERVSVSSLSQGCHRECDQGSAESVDRGVADSDGVHIQMTAEVETEWLDDVGVTEWLDDVGVVSHSIQMDVSDNNCTPPHPPVDAAWCMSSASHQHMDAEAKDDSKFTESVCRSGLRSVRKKTWFVVTVTCSAMADLVLVLFQ